MAELKPCPFCGGAAEPEHLESGRWSVGCQKDPCLGYMSICTLATKREAIEAWNTRAALSGISEVVEALAELVEEHILRGPFDEPLGSSEQSAAINKARAALSRHREGEKL